MVSTERCALWRHATAGLTLLLILHLDPSEVRGHLTGRSTVPDVVQRVIPAVVSIATRHISRDDAEQAVSTRGKGSGVIVDRRKITLTDERTFRAAVVGVDPFTDLAVIRIEGQRLPVARLGASERLRVGETVIAIGNPLWLEGGPSVTVGVVSTRRCSAVGAAIMLRVMTRKRRRPGPPGQRRGPLGTNTEMDASRAHPRRWR